MIAAARILGMSDPGWMVPVASGPRRPAQLLAGRAPKSESPRRGTDAMTLPGPSDELDAKIARGEAQELDERRTTLAALPGLHARALEIADALWARMLAAHKESMRLQVASLLRDVEAPREAQVAEARDAASAIVGRGPALGRPSEAEEGALREFFSTARRECFWRRDEFARMCKVAGNGLRRVDSLRKIGNTFRDYMAALSSVRDDVRELAGAWTPGAPPPGAAQAETLVIVKPGPSPAVGLRAALDLVARNTDAGRATAPEDIVTARAADQDASHIVQAINASAKLADHRRGGKVMHTRTDRLVAITGEGYYLAPADTA